MKEVVFAPDLIGAAFFDPHARTVLERWREGAFKAVFDRQLLILHLKTLRDLGLSTELIKRWTLWLTSPEKSLFLPELNVGELQPIALCEALADAANTQQIVCWSETAGASNRWTPASKFL